VNVVERSLDHVDFDLEENFPPVRRARRWITENVPELDAPTLLDLLLIADALLTNALEHARSPRRLWLSRQSGGHVVRVEVHDASPELLPVLGKPGELGLGHRGLLLVNRVASRWGVDPRAGYKSVWGEVTA
jgi:hypothetical protein